MIPVSTAEKILDEKTFFVSTFLDKYKQVHFKLGFYSKSKKSGLNFYSIFA